MEVLVRIALIKYKGRSPAEATEELIKKILGKYVAPSAQEFRDQLLWTTPVDKLFKANQQSVDQVYEYLFPKF